MNNVIVGSDIILKYPSLSFRNDLIKELTIKNPLYATLERMGRNTYGTPKFFKLFKMIGDDFHIPFGSVSNPKLKSYFLNCNYKKLPHENHFTNLNINIPPLDYQEKALNYILNKKLHRGIIVGGTGSGKTNIGLYLIAKLHGRALWITHKKDLLKQSRDRALAIFNNKVDIGYITEGEIQVGKDITFATVQTLSKCVAEVNDCFDVIIVDEAHHCVGSPTLRTMFFNTLNTLYANYKFGLTATPKRADGLEKMTFALLGEIAYEIPKSEVSERILPVDYYTINNFKKYDIFDFTDAAGMIVPSALTRMLAQDQERNDLIVDQVVDLVKNKNSQGVLVLCKLVVHCELLFRRFQAAGLKVGLITGKVKARKEILESDDLKVIVATNSLAKEGLDLVRYSDLVLTYSVKQKNEFIQAAGRVRRVDGSKKVANVYEVCDFSINYLARRTKTHKNWAKKM